MWCRHEASPTAPSQLQNVLFELLTSKDFIYHFLLLQKKRLKLKIYLGSYQETSRENNPRVRAHTLSVSLCSVTIEKPSKNAAHWSKVEPKSPAGYSAILQRLRTSARPFVLVFFRLIATFISFICLFTHTKLFQGSGMRFYIKPCS